MREGFESHYFVDIGGVIEELNHESDGVIPKY